MNMRMVTMTSLLSAVIEDMENMGRTHEDVEAAVCSLEYNICENSKGFSAFNEVEEMPQMLCLQS